MWTHSPQPFPSNLALPKSSIPLFPRGFPRFFTDSSTFFHDFPGDFPCLWPLRSPLWAADSRWPCPRCVWLRWRPRALRTTRKLDIGPWSMGSMVGDGWCWMSVVDLMISWWFMIYIYMCVCVCMYFHLYLYLFICVYPSDVYQYHVFSWFYDGFQLG